MGDFFIGGIILFGGNFAPRNYAFCAGQLQLIYENQALFAILGTIWGGDGRTNFAVPDMRGRVPIGVGKGVGLTEVYEGQMRGEEYHQLTTPELPSHSHDATFYPTGGGSSQITATAFVNAFNGTGDKDTPEDAYWASGQAINNRDAYDVKKGYSSKANTTMASDAVTIDVKGGGGSVSIGQTGSDKQFSIMQPSLGIPYIIALEGIFPSRN